MKLQATECPNCHTEFTGNFCNNCGQKRITGKITWSEVRNEFMDKFLGLERGFFFTIWALVRSPGQTIRDFLGGARKRFTSPTQFYLVGTTIMFIIYNQFDVFNAITQVPPQTAENKALNHFLEIYLTVFQNMRIVTALGIPFQALIYLWFFKKKRFGFSYLEVLIFTLYTGGIISLLTIPLVILNLIDTQVYAYSASIISFLFYIIASKRFFNSSWTRAIFAFIIYYMLYMLLLILGASIYAIIVIKMEQAVNIGLL